jgi:antitoxin component YwqK of YwqJK toxin-antitoxin module
MNKFLILLLTFLTSVIAQDTTKEPEKEAVKDTPKEAIKLEVKETKDEKTEAIKKPIEVNPNQQALATNKEVIESKVYWDKEQKTKIKIIFPYYIKDGKELAHGVTKSYWPNGKLAKEQGWADGIMDGIETLYSDQGVIERQIIWKKGEAIKEAYFYVDGVLQSETDLKTIDARNPEADKPDIKKQVKNGIENIYFKNGKKKTQIHWKEDKLEGLETKWWENGQKRYEISWKNDKKDGIETQWYKNGQLFYIVNWIENVGQGEVIRYHENGKKKEQIELSKGVYINDTYAWNDKGTLIAKASNKNGSPFKGTIFDEARSLILTFEDGKQVSSKVCDKDGKILQ